MRPIYGDHLNSDAAARRSRRNYAECHIGVLRLVGCDRRLVLKIKQRSG